VETKETATEAMKTEAMQTKTKEAKTRSDPESRGGRHPQTVARKSKTRKLRAPLSV
jgi:hypothetical protein